MNRLFEKLVPLALASALSVSGVANAGAISKQPIKVKSKVAGAQRKAASANAPDGNWVIDFKLKECTWAASSRSLKPKEVKGERVCVGEVMSFDLDATLEVRCAAVSQDGEFVCPSANDCANAPTPEVLKRDIDNPGGGGR